ncbi:MAG: cysteine desulfurase family protein, partial [Rhodoglobus sp.]|nr:cysteine desulfurase family protein [Rhodoglobus sp.]
MLPWFQTDFGNSSSAHVPGRRAADAVELARQQVASLISATPGEIVFTSGATEANNLALQGAWAVRPRTRNRVVISAVEHKAILETAAELPGIADLTVVPVDHHGMVDLSALAQSLDERVAIVSIIAANNEVGTLNPIAQVAGLAKVVGAVVHTDATQWAGKHSLEVHEWDVDLLSLSAHKFYGPKGVGALFVRRGQRIAPLLHGGGQERGVRSGTLNVPGIVGLGAAAELAASRIANHGEAHLEELRDVFLLKLGSTIPGVTLNGHPTDRLCNTLNVRFEGADGEAVLASTPELAASTGSACESASPTPSHVLLAMGLDRAAADECVRFSLGRGTTSAELDNAVDLLAATVARVRTLTAA